LLKGTRPLWSSGQSSWLQIQRSRVWFPALVGLELGPLSLVSTIEELLGRNSSGSGLENREYGRGDPLRWPRDTFYQLKLALTSSKRCGRSVGIVRLRTKATEFCMQFLISVVHIGLIFDDNGLQVSNRPNILPVFRKQVLRILLVKPTTLILFSPVTLNKNHSLPSGSSTKAFKCFHILHRCSSLHIIPAI
jgi:hypothetical protein